MCTPAFRVAARCFSVLLLLKWISVPTLVFGQVNSWTNPASGNWDEPSNWSAGALPNSSHSVFITNSLWKAVAINPSTPVNFPGAMTVGSLTIRGAWDTYNTLLLNSAGTDVPLTVLNGLTIADNAQIVNFNSGLVVEGGTITLTNARIVQDGGFVRMTAAPMNFFNSEYHLTNGVLEAGSVLVGLQGASRFFQYGGTATITNFNFAFTAGPGSGARGYSLYGGILNLPGGLRLEGRGGTTASYLQEGGTNYTSDVLLMPGLTGPSPDFHLNGGWLVDQNVNVWADTIITRLHQNGGAHIVSNVLSLRGGVRTGTVRPAIYYLNDGILSARVIDLDSQGGDSVYIQSNGVARAEQIQAHSYWIFQSELTLAAGSLSCSNLSSTDGGLIRQYGGLLSVTNTLSFGGYREFGPQIPTRFEFLGGTLIASNLQVGGVWTIGDSAGTNRIANAGYISLSHTLLISNAVEQLGRFILPSNGLINLAGAASRLSFAASSSESWGAGAALEVANWNGDASGGGAEQLRFGVNASGLTPAQLSQIQFRFGSDLYTAKILATGEVVPDQPVSAMLASSRDGDDLVLTWPAGWALQTSTNVAGPYADLPGAISPYAADTTLDPQRFFRLRR